jgi:hypothetical protein
MMSVVKLKINEPQHGQNFLGASIRMRGEVLSTGHPQLHFKWYSNLVPPKPPPPPTNVPPNTEAAINGAGDNPLNFMATLPVGTHIITFAASNINSNDATELQKVTDAGMAGGPALDPPPPNAPPPCVIHVLVAQIDAPVGGASLSKAAAKTVIAAKVNSKWGDRDYQAKLNRIQFRWRFEPSGAPANRPTVEFVPEFDFNPPLASDPQPAGVLKLPFTFDAEKLLMRFEGQLPPALGTGSYVLKLRVERKDDALVGQDDSRQVTITA